MKKLPTRNELMGPTIEAIKDLGGSANTDEIYEKIVEKMQLSDSLLEVIKRQNWSIRITIQFVLG